MAPPTAILVACCLGSVVVSFDKVGTFFFRRKKCAKVKRNSF